MIRLHPAVVVAAVSLAGVCRADVVHFEGPYTWGRLEAQCSGAPPSVPGFFDVTLPADQQPTQHSSRVFTHNDCPGGITSCGAWQLRQMSGNSLLRDTAVTTFTHCGQQRSARAVHMPAAGTVIGATPAPRSEWAASADHLYGSCCMFTLLHLPAYVGLRVSIDNQTHYGWARLTSFNGSSYTVAEWAYESTPDAPIIVGAVETPCPCDFDSSGDVSSQDFFGFLDCFFDPACLSDFNQDSVENSADFFDYLDCFLTLPGSC